MVPRGPRQDTAGLSASCRPAPPGPAVVTGPLSPQVPAYPEVFRDSLHGYKFSEQDTDVRAARLPLVSAPWSPSLGLPRPLSELPLRVGPPSP